MPTLGVAKNMRRIGHFALIPSGPKWDSEDGYFTTRLALDRSGTKVDEADEDATNRPRDEEAEKRGGTTEKDDEEGQFPLVAIKQVDLNYDRQVQYMRREVHILGQVLGPHPYIVGLAVPNHRGSTTRGADAYPDLPVAGGSMPGKKQEGEGHEPLRTPTSTTGFGFLDDQKGVASGDRLHTTATCQYFALEPAAASGTTLESMTVDVKEKLNEDAARHLFRQLLLGLQHAHDRDVAHCYLSLRNLLVVSETTNHPSNQPSAGKRSSPTPESDGGRSTRCTTKKMPAAGSAPANKSTAATSKTNKNSETITTSKKSTSEPKAKKTVGVEVNKFNDQRKHCQWTLKISGFGAKDFEDPQERKIPLPSFVAPEAQSYGAHVPQEVPQVKEPAKHKNKTKNQPKREDDEGGLEINNNNSRQEGEEEEEGAPVSATARTGAGRRFDHLKADCWSCGAILFAMVTGRLPFADSQGSSSRMHSKIDDCRSAGGCPVEDGLSAWSSDAR